MRKPRMPRYVAVFAITIGMAGTLALEVAGPAAAQTGQGARSHTVAAKLWSSSSAAAPAVATSDPIKIERAGYCLSTTEFPYIYADGCAQGSNAQKFTRQGASNGLYKIEQTLNNGVQACLTTLNITVNAQGFDQCKQGDGDEKFSLDPTSDGQWKIEQSGSCLFLDPVQKLIGFEPCQQGDGNQKWSFNAAS